MFPPRLIKTRVWRSIFRRWRKTAKIFKEEFLMRIYNSLKVNYFFGILYLSVLVIPGRGFMELSHFTLLEITICRINLLYMEFLFFLILGKHGFFFQMYTFFSNIGRGFYLCHAANHNVSIYHDYS